MLLICTDQCKNQCTEGITDQYYYCMTYHVDELGKQTPILLFQFQRMVWIDYGGMSQWVYSVKFVMADWMVG